MVTINLKGVIGDSITATVDSEDTNQFTIKFDDSTGNGIRSVGQLPDTVTSMGWYYASQKDLEITESIYNTEISKKKIWKDTSVEIDI